MKCKHKECYFSDDCEILEIVKKEPDKADKCSYFKSHNSKGVRRTGKGSYEDAKI
jgi:hypothetical protein